MATVLDVARYILERCGELPAMKLQKLCYYSQAWSLVWDDRPLFGDRVEAWAHGPVMPALYEAHRGQFLISPATIPGNPGNLDEKAIDAIDTVIKAYIDKSSQWLSDMTHSELPWIEARHGLSAGQRGNREITHAAMAEYYGAL